MTQYVFANNVSTTLAAAATNTATTLTLSSSANFPSLGSGQVFPLTLNDAATGQVYEIVYVTAISGVTLTVERGKEGTIAQTWAVGDYAYDSHTAETTASATGNPKNVFEGADSTGGTQEFIPRTQGDALYAALSSFGNTLQAAKGHQNLPGGLILQWVHTTINVTSTNTSIHQAVTWETAFPTAYLGGIMTNDGNTTGLDQMHLNSGSTTGVTITVLDSSQTGNNDMTVWALGY